MSTAASSKSVASQIWGIYYTDREYARVMGDPLRTVVEAHSKLAAEEEAARLGFSQPWAHPIDSEQAHKTTELVPRIETDIHRPPLFVRTPSPAELHTGIQVLEKLGERLSTQANHSMMELPKTQLGKQYADKIEANATEQIERIKSISAQLNGWRDELLQQRKTVSNHV